MAVCRVELSATINVGNFNSVKATVAFEEGYDALGSPSERDAKYSELLEVCNEKLDIAILEGIRKVKAMTKEKS